jgi:deubiquitinating protein VCIP135
MHMSVAAVFLPALVNPEECKGKTKELNLPLCLAWSSSARNHFIPLVGIEGGDITFLVKFF